MDRSLTCIITGNKYTFASGYFERKAEEYGGVENLKKYFVTKKVKSLIQRGYGVDEIRKILNIDEDSVLPSDDTLVNTVMAYHTLQNNAATRRTNNIFTNLKSDDDVSEYIRKIKQYTQQLQ